MSQITLGRVVAHCACCGHVTDPSAPASEHVGEQFCSEVHAEQFAEGVRSARRGAAARRGTPGGTCSPPSVGQQHWRDYLKRGACWGAPLLLLLAVALFWTGSAWGATGGSLLSVLALLACPLGMYFMMRAMGPTHRGANDDEASAAGRRRE
jgi:hypothetical protein